MYKCTTCGKNLVKEGKTSLCITCFNKARIGSKNPSWKGGISKKRNPFSRFNGPLNERFGSRNPMFGRKVSEETRKKMSVSQRNKSQGTRERISVSKIGEKNPMWKGEDVGYEQLHRWVRSRFPKPELCIICKKVPPIDLANKGIYTRDLTNWEYLCRSCHMKKDGRSRKGYVKVDRTSTHKERMQNV